MDAFPLPLLPGTVAPRRLPGGIAFAAAVVLSIWLVIAAGLQQAGSRDETMPAPLPDMPSIVRADLGVSDAAAAPVPGAEIAPMDGSLSPR